MPAADATRKPARVRLPDGLRQAWRARLQRWLNRRIPPGREIRLNQRNLFVLPSRQGGGYLLTAALIWIGATNFQNNLVLALCFLLLALLFVTLHQTFANLSGLSLRHIATEPVFAGDTALCLLELDASRPRQQLALGFAEAPATQVSMAAGQPLRTAVAFPTHRRGRQRPGRLRVQSVYPYGLIRCWTWLDLDIELLVYPRPLDGEIPSAPGGTGSKDRGQPIAGSDDFLGLRGYVRGDPLARISWKHQAAGHGLLVREQVDYRSDERWLDYAALGEADPETRLSRLCRHALDLTAEGRAFGLRLPGTRIEPDRGDGHLRAVLRALAECPVS